MDAIDTTDGVNELAELLGALCGGYRDLHRALREERVRLARRLFGFRPGPEELDATRDDREVAALHGHLLDRIEDLEARLRGWLARVPGHPSTLRAAMSDLPQGDQERVVPVARELKRWAVRVHNLSTANQRFLADSFDDGLTVARAGRAELAGYGPSGAVEPERAAGAVMRERA